METMELLEIPVRSGHMYRRVVGALGPAVYGTVITLPEEMDSIVAKVGLRVPIQVALVVLVDMDCSVLAVEGMALMGSIPGEVVEAQDMP